MPGPSESVDGALDLPLPETRPGLSPHWWREHAPSGEFWNLFAATALYNCGLAGFGFLYNLYMLDRGFGERPLGVLTSATILGLVVGTVPMGILAGRFGLRRMMVLSLLLLAMLCVGKVGFAAYSVQMTLDFVGGLLMCGWCVCLFPLVSIVVESKRRPFAFSLLYSVAIVSCGLGGFLGGHMPGWWQHAAGSTGRALTILQSKQLTMLMLTILTGLSSFSLALMKAEARRTKGFTQWKINPLLTRFFAATACWSFALGSFNPFLNIFLTRNLGMPLWRLGTIASISQLLHAALVLATPWLLRRLNLIASIIVTQLLAASSLLVLATSHNWTQATVGMFGFLAAQHMTEPGMQAFLMNGAGERERSGASAVYFLVNSLAGASAAIVGGAALARFGYPAVLTAVAGLALCAAMLFRSIGHVPQQAGELSPSVERAV